MTALTGLSNSAVAERRQKGEINTVHTGVDRTDWDIIRVNVFSRYNNILFIVGLMLGVMGRPKDAFVIGIVGLINGAISAVQEIRSKRQLERIAVVARPTVTVLREGAQIKIAPSDIVKDDLIHLSSGEQAVVDGQMVGDGSLEMDEALLTGESDLVTKKADDEILSGSFCITGHGYYRADKVGPDSYASELTAEAQRFAFNSTPLQKQVSIVTNLLMLLAGVMAVLFYANGVMQELRFIEDVKATAVLLSLVPYGLFLSIAIAYALGATKIAQQGALIQQTNSVESLNYVTVLCMDKTGTLTANELVLDDVRQLDSSLDTKAMLGDFVHNISDGNMTNRAIADGVVGEKRQPIAEIAFSSARKWSALAFDEAERQGIYVLGAIEMLQPYLADESVTLLRPIIGELSDKGLRVLLFAYNPQPSTLKSENGQPELPMLQPLGIISLRDTLRPQVKETLQQFQDLGVQLKIISGDNAQTVAALARQVGLGDVKFVSGTELSKMDETMLRERVSESVVFGRISPAQKQQLVDLLIQQGHYVAMIGDGVNDVLSLKKAHLGIAMQSGSNATRNVADMILLNDSYAALIPALKEGKRIANGITNASYLFFGRALVYALAIIGILMAGLNFPVEPTQIGLTTLSVGLPSLCLLLWARPSPNTDAFIPTTTRLLIPFGIWTMLIAVFLYAFTEFQAVAAYEEGAIPLALANQIEIMTGIPYGSTEDFAELTATVIAQTILSSFLTLVMLLFLLILEPPFRLFTVWRDEVSTDRRPLWLVIGLSASLLIGLNFKPFTDSLSMIRPTVSGYISIMVALLIWFVGIRLILKHRLFDKILP